MDPGRRQRVQLSQSTVRASPCPARRFCEQSAFEAQLAADDTFVDERFRDSACAGFGSTAQPRAANGGASSEAIPATAMALFLGMPHGSERPQLPA
ncbi:hypothetical protein PaG_05476 [Moesziomyces aphidis]|uniref:Uncharacterized protein n=1 Tax=Moesziomyces aphidis TaxID=84754 RepID=W3VIP7_MOEAP|nr:hypothetical protein PaG_05476 [Moesziomyces aphidis]